MGFGRELQLYRPLPLLLLLLLLLLLPLAGSCNFIVPCRCCCCCCRLLLLLLQPPPWVSFFWSCCCCCCCCCRCCCRPLAQTLLSVAFKTLMGAACGHRSVLRQASAWN